MLQLALLEREATGSTFSKHGTLNRLARPRFSFTIFEISINTPLTYAHHRLLKSSLIRDYGICLLSLAIIHRQLKWISPGYDNLEYSI